MIFYINKYKYLVLTLNIIVYTISLAILKLSSQAEIFSVKYFTYVFMTLLLMALYAVLWQILLKVLPLSSAYSAKGLVIIFSLIIGFLLFGENIKLTNLIGGVFIIGGIVLVNKYE